VILQRHHGIASSYDCSPCQCPAPTTGLLQTSPAPAWLGVGSALQFAADLWFQSCNGSYYVNDTGSAGWYSSNKPVATVNTSGMVAALLAGSTTVTATMNGQCYRWQQIGYACSCQQPGEPSGGGQVNAVSATITVRFTGSKSVGDGLMFTPSVNTCSEYLGLHDCSTSTQTWPWNVEVVATVTDDASKWTVSQLVGATGSGQYKDSSGVLHGFNDLIPAGTNDTPDAGLIQQTSGQKTIYWIDAPARKITATVSSGTFPVDSVTDTYNFTSKVCSTEVTTYCQSVSWYYKLAVKPGAVLDTTNSGAGLGTK
jgi:Bacterial Ig-like domain (group 2)